MARLLVIVLVSLVLQQTLAAPAKTDTIQQLLDRLFTKKDNIPTSTSDESKESDDALRRADGPRQGEAPDAMHMMMGLAQYIVGQKPCGKAYHILANDAQIDLDSLAVSPQELNNVLTELKEFSSHAAEKMSNVKDDAKAGMTAEEGKALEEKAVGTFKSLAEKSQCAMGLLHREFMRLEIFGAKGFDKSQYRCRHLASLMFRLAGKVHNAQASWADVMDAETWGKVGEAAITDLHCLSAEVSALSKDIEMNDGIDKTDDPNQVGRDMLKVLLEFGRVHQDAEMLMRTGMAIKAGMEAGERQQRPEGGKGMKGTEKGKGKGKKNAAKGGEMTELDIDNALRTIKRLLEHTR